MWTTSVTLASAAAGVALALFFGWRGARPPDVHRGPRMAPYRFLMLLAVAWVVLMLVHLVNLLGVPTGR
jgi:predicted membrane channel-forming protein YqfA (hemolysin III family)